MEVTDDPTELHFTQLFPAHMLHILGVRWSIQQFSNYGECVISAHWKCERNLTVCYLAIECLSSTGGSLCLWFVPGWGWLEQKEHQSHRVITQSTLHTHACHPHVCHQIHCSCGSEAVRLPHLQETKAYRPQLHYSSGATYCPVTRPLDLTWGCPALWHQIINNYYFFNVQKTNKCLSAD